MVGRIGNPSHLESAAVSRPRHGVRLLSLFARRLFAHALSLLFCQFQHGELLSLTMGDVERNLIACLQASQKGNHSVSRCGVDGDSFSHEGIGILRLAVFPLPNDLINVQDKSTITDAHHGSADQAGKFCGRIGQRQSSSLTGLGGAA